MRPLVLSLLLALPAFVGCLGDDEVPSGEAAPVAKTAEEAGARAGEAPAAATQPYQVQVADDGSGSAAPKTVTAYPVTLPTNPAKPPVTLNLDGEFGPETCNPAGGVPFGGLGFANNWHFNDLSESLEEGDVYSYDLQLKFTNTEQSWGELHLFYGLDGNAGGWNEPTAELRGEVVQNFTGQSYRVDDEGSAWVGVACWYGFVTSPIAYTLTVTLTFAQNAVPSGAPMLLEVPDNATSLIVTGVPLDASQGVASHYRIFGPDDELVCECGLNSNEAAASFALPGPGDYVVLVDHTANGFVAFALDAPPAAPLKPLASEFVVYPLASANGEPVDVTANVELPSTPLALNGWVTPPGATTGEGGPLSVGGGKGVAATVTNGRGEVMRMKLGGYATFRAELPGFVFGEWVPVPFPDTEWEFFVDHHLYGPGAHEVHVKADQMRGDAVLFALHYVRA